MIPVEWIGAAGTVEAAVQKGLRKLGFTRDQVDIRVLGEKTSTLFSLFGFRRVEVKLTVKAGVIREQHRAAAALEAQRGQREGRRDEKRGRGDGRRDRNERRDGGRRDDSRRGGDRPRGDDRGRDRDHGRRDRDDRPQQRGGGGRDGRRDGRQQDQPRREDSNRRHEQPRHSRERAEDRRPPREQGPAKPPRDPKDIPAPDALLTQWKSLLAWDDLAWSPRNGESGDITLVLDAASGERLLANDGQPLRCLEHLLNVVRSKGDHSVPRVVLRVDGHETEEEERDLPAVARQAAEEALRNGEPVRLDPMSARDRKVIHQTLAGRRDVETSSEGEGQYRKVVITPKAK